jgi:hypothetical protein
MPEITKRPIGPHELRKSGKLRRRTMEMILIRLVAGLLALALLGDIMNRRKQPAKR